MKDIGLQTTDYRLRTKGLLKAQRLHRIQARRLARRINRREEANHHGRQNDDGEVKREDDLPLPNPAPLREWWQSHKATLNPNLRYVLGRPVEPEATALALWTGPMWRRRVFRLGLGREIMARLDLRQWARTQRLEAPGESSGPPLR